MRRLLLATTALIGLVSVAAPAVADPVSIAVTIAVAVAQGASFAVIAGMVAIQVGLSLVGQALAPKPKRPDFSAFKAQARDRTVLVRQPIVARKLIYGQARVSGPLLYVQSTDSNNYLHLIVGIASHEVESLGDVYLDDRLSTDSRYSGLVRIEKYLGTPDQAASADLIAESGGKWTSNHRLRGIAYLYVRLKWDQSVWTNGIPTVKVDVEGANQVEDPRESGSPTYFAYTRNPPLLIRHYLKDTRYGLGCTDEEIDDDYFIAAANTCEEQVEKAGGGSPTEFENRYYCDGVIDTANTPQEILQELLTSCGGRLVYSGGKWRLYVAAYDAPTLTFDEGDLAGPLKVKTRVSQREAFSAVKGVYVSPENVWQPSDYPAIKSDAARQELGLVDHKYRDHNLPFTISPSMAQRLAKIELLKARQPITVDAVFNLSAFQFQAGDTINLTNERFGWSAKAFEVIEWTLAMQNDAAGSPALVVRTMLRETASSIYDWSTDEEQTVDDAPDTDLPDPFTVGEPSGLTLQSGTAQLFTRLDGTIFSRIRASWTPPADAFVTSGGRIEGQIRGPLGQSPTPDWVDAFDVPGSATEAYILDVQDGQEYEVRIRSKNARVQAASDWAPGDDGASHTVIGKTEPPSNVSGFSAQQNGNVVTERWNQVSDLDLAGYEIRYMAAPFVWDNATVLTSVTRGTLVTNASIPPGDWVLGIKARDTSGNYSTSAATFALTVTNGNDVVEQEEQYPDWRGTLDGFVLHGPTRRLIPNSTSLAGALGWELFDEFVPDAVSDAYYTAPEIDLGFDADGVRVYSEATAALGPSETGVADALLEIDYRDEADPYDGFEPWSVGYVNLRRLKARVHIETASGVAYVERFKPVLDVAERTLALGVRTIAPGGTRIDFTPRFFSQPSISFGPQLSAGSPSEPLFPFWDDLDGTGGTFHMLNASGQSVGGQTSITAIGA